MPPCHPLWVRVLSLAAGAMCCGADCAQLAVAAEEISSKQEFLNAYRPHAKRFLEEGVRFRVEASFERQAQGEVIEESKVDVYRRDSALRVDVLPAEESIDSPARVRVLSPERSFALERGGQDQDYFITELSGEDAANNFMEIEESVRVKRPIVAPWYAYFETTVDSWTSRPDVKLTEAFYEESQPNVLVAKFERHDTTYDVTQYMQFELDTTRGWSLTGYRMGTAENYFRVDVEYAEGDEYPPRPLSLIKKRIDKKFDPENDVSYEEYRVIEFSDAAPSSQIFRLSHFGLEDDTGIGSSSNLIVLLLVLIALGVAAAVLVARRQA